MSETWYEILGVEPTASDAEVKSAWRSLVTVLGPTDHRFASINQAASVLLDPDQRAEYDASLAPAETATDAVSLAKSEPVAEQATVKPEPEPEPEPEHEDAAQEPQAEVVATADPATKPDTEAHPKAESAVPAGLLAARPAQILSRVSVMVATVVLALALLVATILVWTLNGGGTSAGAAAASAPTTSPGSATNVPVASGPVTIKLTDTNLKPIQQQVPTLEGPDVRAAIAAAVAATPKLLNYDYRTLASWPGVAKPYMTAEYAKSFMPYFTDMVSPNAKRQHTVTVCDPVLDAGVVRTAPGLVDVLVIVDVRTSFTGTSVVAQNFADLSMTWSNGSWLVSHIGTAPIAK